MILRTIVAMAACGVLYAVFVIFFPQDKCNGHCAGCTGTCDLANRRPPSGESP
jgi:hypothetical protein